MNRVLKQLIRSPNKLIDPDAKLAVDTSRKHYDYVSSHTDRSYLEYLIQKDKIKCKTPL